MDANKISRQSCLAWTVYVILDIYANFLRSAPCYCRECEGHVLTSLAIVCVQDPEPEQEGAGAAGAKGPHRRRGA